MHGGNQRHAVCYATGMHYLFYLRRNVDVFAMLLRVEGEIFRVKFHAKPALDRVSPSSL
jgi:hypothetical protein